MAETDISTKVSIPKSTPQELSHFDVLKLNVEGKNLATESLSLEEKFVIKESNLVREIINGRKAETLVDLDRGLNYSNKCVEEIEKQNDLIKPKRGRGRPRKNPSSVVESEPAPTTVKRKRGRPRKCPIAETKDSLEGSEGIDKNLEHVEYFMGPSKRGRIRKEIDYFLLDDPGAEFETKRRKVSRQGVQDDSFESDLSNSAFSEPGVETSEDRSVLNCDIPDENISCNNECASKSKYTYTGHKVKMLKHIFQSSQEKSVHNKRQDFSDLPDHGKKYDAQPSFRSDEEPMNSEQLVFCMICNQNMNNSEWLYHRKKIHYNLAWKYGDPPLDIHDDKFILNTLKSLKQEQKKLKCHRCGERASTATAFLEHLELCNGIVTPAGMVTCAVCKQSMKKSNWQYHKYKSHNNLAWRLGDRPLDLDNQDVVMRILNQLYKARKPLTCEKCGVIKKSVIGFLSHKSTCQKTLEELEKVRVTCDLCFKKMLPVSLEYHVKVCHSEHKEVLPAAKIVPNCASDDNHKRKAAQQALQIINKFGNGEDVINDYVTNIDFRESYVDIVLSKELTDNDVINCKYPECMVTETTVEKIISHMESCILKPLEYYACKECLSIFQDQSDIEKHIKSAHKCFADDNYDFLNDEDDHVEDDRLLKKFQKEKDKAQNNATYRMKPLFLMTRSRLPKESIYEPSTKWMSQFCENCYFNKHVFPSMRNNSWKLVQLDLLEKFLPKTHKSCDVAANILIPDSSCNSTDDCSFRQLELFESAELCAGDKTIFCGGPISALAWLPTPHNENRNNQILAVSVLNEMDDKYYLDVNYTEESLIQIWDFGILKNKEKIIPNPYLLYGICLNVGPIWHMEWCPSGCFESSESEPNLRLGLLAVASSDGSVYIFPIEGPPERDRGLFYKGQPNLKLQLSSETNYDDPQTFYPSRISWTKAPGHKYIAVGYSHGMVALFDVSCDSNMLRRETVDGENVCFPYVSFQAHMSLITGLTLSHLSEGNRWLLTSSLDRSVIFWDLATLTKLSSHKNYAILDSTWMTQWLSCIVADIENGGNTKMATHTTLKPMRDFLVASLNLTTSQSSIRSFSFSDWLNGLVHGTFTGEIMGIFPDRLLHLMDKRNGSFEKYLFSRTRVVPKQPTCYEVEETEVFSYENMTSNYGLMFLDYKLDDLTNFPKNFHGLNDNEFFPPSGANQYPLQSVNKIAFNPNSQACTYFVTGYQAGFVRLTRLAFLKDYWQIV